MIKFDLIRQVPVVSNNRIGLFARGLSEDPSEQRLCPQGLRVRPSERYPSYGHQCKGEPFAFLNNRNVEYIGNQSFLISRTPNAQNNNVST